MSAKEDIKAVVFKEWMKWTKKDLVETLMEQNRKVIILEQELKNMSDSIPKSNNKPAF